MKEEITQYTNDDIANSFIVFSAGVVAISTRRFSLDALRSSLHYDILYHA